jgi:hypothetical protein
MDLRCKAGIDHHQIVRQTEDNRSLISFKLIDKYER